MRTFVTLFLCLIFYSSYSQTFNWATPCIGNGSVSGISTYKSPEGFVYSLGVYDNPSDSNNIRGIILQKLTSSGDPMWSKEMKYLNGGSMNYSLTADNGAAYISFSLNGEIEINNTAVTSSSFDLIVIKVKENGVIENFKKFGGVDYEGVQSLVAKNGELYLLGRVMGYAEIDTFQFTGAAHFFIARFNSALQIVWAKELATTGGAGNIGRMEISQSQNRLIVYGEFTDDLYLDSITLTSNGFNDLFITSVDLDGNFKWARKIGGIYQERPSELQLDKEGYIYIAGFYNESVDFGNGSITAPSSDTRFFAKYDLNGSLLFQLNKNISGFKIRSDMNIVSISGNEIKLMDNQASNLLWSETISGAIFSNISIDSTHIYLTGRTNGTASFDSHIISNGSMFTTELQASLITSHRESLKRADFLIYPNPTTSNTINISSEFRSGELIELSIYDSTGRLVQADKVIYNEPLMTNFNLPRGIYTVNITNNQRVTRTGRFTVR